MAPTKRRTKAPVIPLKPDYDKSSIEYVKHRRSEAAAGVTEEVQERVPIIDDSSTPFQKLEMFSAFAKARRHLGWTTGPKLFQRFAMQLEGTHLATWDDQVAGVNATVANFDANLITFKATILAGYRHGNQLDYLRSLKKPKELTPGEFLLLFRASETRARSLPGAPAAGVTFGDEERRRIFLHAMPVAWQEKFDDANLRLEDETIEDMCIYFDKLQENDPYVEPARASNQQHQQDSNRNQGQHGRGGSDNRNRGRGGGGRGGSRGGNNNNNNNRNDNSRGGRGGRGGGNNVQRIQNTDTCPLPGHANHLWGACRSNRYGFEQQGGQNANAGNNNSNRGAGNQRRENNNVEQNQNNDSQQQNNNRNANNNRNQNSNNGNPQNPPSNYYFCLETESNDVATSPESFFFEDGVQEVLEQERETVIDLVEPEPTKLPEGVPREAMVPSTLAISKQVNDTKGHFLFKSLLDPGGSDVMVNKRSLPRAVETFSLPTSDTFNTTAGGLQTKEYVFLHEIILPEFSYSRRVKTFKAFVFDNEAVEYDIIFGRNFLNSCGIDICGSDLTCKWFSDSIPFHAPDFFRNKSQLHKILEVAPQRVQSMEQHAAALVTATKDTKVSVEEVVRRQHHLSTTQQNELLDVLNQHTTLFDGTLGTYKRRQFSITLKDDVVPYHCKGPYSIPCGNMPVLKEELQRQENIGILKRVQESEWGMPMMVIQKKDGAIRTIDDFRELNKYVKRKCYPLPKIQDVFHRRQGYAYMSKLDLALCYYTYELTEESSWLCVLVTPFGKYRRTRVPMGLMQAADWAQAALEEELMEADLLRECVEAYIDDIGLFSNSWTDHINQLNKTLGVLEKAGYKINPAKCEWGVRETEWLGHWMTPEGIKPLQNKVQGILDIAPPTTVTQLRSFIGMVNFYRDFWGKRAHIMAPLTKLTKLPKGSKIPWDKEQNDAFKAVKAMLAEEVLLYYPDPNKEFIIEPDASKLQLGATIYQMNGSKKQPVAFFSRKLTPAQTRYPASDLEALCITEMFEEYRSILYGARIRVRTDHKNLTARDLKSQRLLHWRLLLEEFAPVFEYLPGEENVVGDPLSRLPTAPTEEQDETELESQLHECLLFYPEDVDEFPLQLDRIATAQQDDPEMLPLADRDEFEIQNFAGTDLIARQHDGRWKIVLPQILTQPTIAWYHNVLGHCGITRLVNSLQKNLWIPNIKRQATEYVSTCDECQRNKFPGPGYGELPPVNDVADLWETVAVDCIGPWTLRLPAGTITVSALTIIDVTSTLSETIRIENKTSMHMAMLFENHWLARYPRPIRCIHDQGTEFMGMGFQNMLQVNGIRSVPTSVRNPQANAVCERMHKTVQDMLQSSLRSPPDNVATAVELVDSCLAAAGRALRSVIHQTLQISPGALVFHRDMLLPIPMMADYNLLRERRQATIDENARRANLRRRFKDYVIGDQVLLVLKSLGTLSTRTAGPYTVTQVHVNGTLTIDRGNGVTERINIRRVQPYHARLPAAGGAAAGV